MCASSHCRGRILAVSDSALAQHLDHKGIRVVGQFVTVDKTDHGPAQDNEIFISTANRTSPRINRCGIVERDDLVRGAAIEIVPYCQERVASIRNSLCGSQSNSLPAAHDARPALNTLAANPN
jgi:hypothetical protein